MIEIKWKESFLGVTKGDINKSSQQSQAKFSIFVVGGVKVEVAT